MNRAMLNIQGLNEDSNAFQTEIENNMEENKGFNDEKSAPNMKPFSRDTKNKEDNNGGKTWLDIISQCDEICEVYNVTKKMKLSNAKLATFDLCNNTADKSAKAHRDSLLLTFIQKRKIISALE